MAIQFTQESSDRVIIADSPNSDLPSGDWSIGIRFKFSTLTYGTQDPYIFTKDFGGGGARWYFGVSEFGTGYDYPFCGFADGTNPEVYLEYTTESFSAGVWYTFVCVRSSGTVTMYINNVSRDTDAGTLGAVQPAGDVWIGNREETPPIDRGFPGDLAEPFICDYALSADDRQAYEDGISPLMFTGGLPTWYARLIDQNDDEVINGDAISTSGTIVDTDHPPVIYPSTASLLGVYNQTVTGTLHSATGVYAPAAINLINVITGALLSATMLASSSIVYAQAVTAPVLSATLNAATYINVQQTITGALLSATQYASTYINVVTPITAPLFTATGLYAASRITGGADFFISTGNTDTDFAIASNNTDTDFAEVD